jgi:heme exporter protein D
MTNLVVASIVVGALVWVALMAWIVSINPTGGVWLEVAKALLNLAVLVVVSVILKLLVDRHAEGRQRREELRTRRVEALNKLTLGYFSVKKALHLIHGYGTIEVYGEQMRQIIDQRYVLQQLSNEADAGLFELPCDENVVSALGRLDAQLSRIIDEWRKAFPTLGTGSRGALRRGDADATEISDRIATLDVLLHIRDNHYAALHDPFVAAATPFRDALASTRKPLRGGSRTNS